jgi:hypothetical protein
MSVTTYIAKHDGAVVGSRASESMSYTHAVLVIDKQGPGIVSWHLTKAAATKAANGAKAVGRTVSVVPVEKHAGAKATVLAKLAKAEEERATAEVADRMAKVRAAKTAKAAPKLVAKPSAALLAALEEEKGQKAKADKAPAKAAPRKATPATVSERLKIEKGSTNLTVSGLVTFVARWDGEVVASRTTTTTSRTASVTHAVVVIPTGKGAPWVSSWHGTKAAAAKAAERLNRAEVVPVEKHEGSGASVLRKLDGAAPAKAAKAAPAKATPAKAPAKAAAAVQPTEVDGISWGTSGAVHGLKEGDKFTYHGADKTGPTTKGVKLRMTIKDRIWITGVDTKGNEKARVHIGAKFWATKP